MDILTRLLLNTDGFDAKLNSSKKGVQSFEGTITLMASKAGAGVLKLAGGIGVAMGSVEAFNKAINSSQTLSDEYGRTMEGLKGSVDNFFYSISNGDFSPFLEGLGNSITLAREAYNALDQLWNTATSYDYFSMKNQAGIQDQIAILKDKNSTKEQKEAARAEAERLLKEQEEITGQLERRSSEAFTAMIRKSTGFKNLDVSQMDFEAAIALDVKSIGDEKKAELAKQYEEFTNVAAKLQSKFVKTTTSYSSTGIPMMHTETDQEKFGEALKPLLRQYQDAIVYNATLVKESDEWLTKATQIGTKAYMADRAIASLRKSINRASQSETGGSKKPKVDNIQLIAANSEAWAKQEALGGTKFKQPLEQPLKIVPLPISTEEILEEALPQSELEIKLKAKLENAEYAKKKIAELKELMEVATTPEEKKQLSGQMDEWAQFGGILNQDSIKQNNDYAESLGGIASIMGAISNMTNDGAGAWLTWSANLMTAVGGAIPLIDKLTKAKQGEAMANAVVSATETPIVGWLMAGAAVASVVAAFASMPKLANGGIAYGNSIVNVGEYAGASGNPEVIAPLSKLREYIQPREGSNAPGGEVVFTISGTNLKGVLTNVERKHKKFS